MNAEAIRLARAVLLPVLEMLLSPHFGNLDVQRSVRYLRDAADILETLEIDR